MNALPNLANHLIPEGIESEDGIAGHFCKLAHGVEFVRADWQLIRRVLADGGVEGLDLTRPEAERRLRKALLAALALPQFHLQ